MPELEKQGQAAEMAGKKFSAAILQVSSELQDADAKLANFTADRKERLGAGDLDLDDLENAISKATTARARLADRLAVLQERNAAAVAERSATADEMRRLQDAEKAEKKRAAAAALASELHGPRLQEVIDQAVALDRAVGSFISDALRLVGTPSDSGEWRGRIAEIITLGRLRAHQRDHCLAPSANAVGFSSREMPALLAAIMPNALEGDQLLPVPRQLVQPVRL